MAARIKHCRITIVVSDIVTVKSNRIQECADESPLNNGSTHNMPEHNDASWTPTQHVQTHGPYYGPRRSPPRLSGSLGMEGSSALLS